MTAIILVLIVIAMIFMAVLAWGLCAAAGAAEEQSEKKVEEYDNGKV